MLENLQKPSHQEDRAAALWHSTPQPQEERPLRQQEEVRPDYDDDMVTLLAAVWGDGYLSTGGPEEVDRVLAGLDLSGKRVLDIGCGAGGIDIHLVEAHGAAEVVGIDTSPCMIDHARTRAAARGLEDRLTFLTVTPGRLPFADASFDVVFSKDAIIHVADKRTLAAEIHRVLKSGGIFAASDWLAGYEGAPSPAVEAYVEAEGLGFVLESARRYEVALTAAGFPAVSLTDRNAWYRGKMHQERNALAGPLYGTLVAQLGQAYVDHSIDTWDKMMLVIQSGEVRPTHLRAQKL